MSTEQCVVDKSGDITWIITAMREAVPSLDGAMVATSDGMVIAHDFEGHDAEGIAAMAATALGLGQRIAERSDVGQLAEMVIRGDNGYLMVQAIGTEAALVVTGSVDSNVGLARIEARAASVEVGHVLRGG